MANHRKRRVEAEVDLQTLLRAIIRRIWLVGIVAILCACLAFLGTRLFVRPQYQCYTVFYVNNSTAGNNLSVEYSDLSVSKSLADSCQVILLTRQTLDEIIDESGVDIDYLELRDKITAKSMNNTEIIRVTVTANDPQDAYKLTKAIEQVMPGRTAATLKGSSVQVVDTAVLSTARTGPNYTLSATIGFALGALITVGAIVLWALLDNRIRMEEDITRICPHPVLAAVPNMLAGSKGGYYGYGQKKQGGGTKRKTELLGPDISFAASEAYKLLRTKILFSFADVQRCRVIGVSSAQAGEGKSLTAVNLAYSLSEIGKKVLLIDCDLRRPSVSEKLGIRPDPGLSNYLTGQSTLEQAIQPCGISGEEHAFYVMTAGPNPPNPQELLGSKRMSQLLDMLRKEFDYVLLDFPPAGEVSDALSFSKQTDGMLLVVRQNYCNRKLFGSTVKQFKYMESKVLGVVYNCTSEGRGIYRKYLYKYRGGTYKNSYEASSMQARKTAKKK